MTQEELDQYTDRRWVEIMDNGTPLTVEWTVDIGTVNGSRFHFTHSAAEIKDDLVLAYTPYGVHVYNRSDIRSLEWKNPL